MASEEQKSIVPLSENSTMDLKASLVAALSQLIDNFSTTRRYLVARINPLSSSFYAHDTCQFYTYSDIYCFKPRTMTEVMADLEVVLRIFPGYMYTIVDTRIDEHQLPHLRQLFGSYVEQKPEPKNESRFLVYRFTSLIRPQYVCFQNGEMVLSIHKKDALIMTVEQADLTVHNYKEADYKKRETHHGLPHTVFSYAVEAVPENT